MWLVEASLLFWIIQKIIISLSFPFLSILVGAEVDFIWYSWVLHMLWSPPHCQADACLPCDWCVWLINLTGKTFLIPCVYILSLGRYWDLQFTCPGFSLLKSNKIIIKLLLVPKNTNKKTSDSNHHGQIT